MPIRVRGEFFGTADYPRALCDRMICRSGGRMEARRMADNSLTIRPYEEQDAELGCPKVNLQVRASNEAVVAFYCKLGYTIEERVSLGKRLLP